MAQRPPCLQPLSSNPEICLGFRDESDPNSWPLDTKAVTEGCPTSCLDCEEIEVSVKVAFPPRPSHSLEDTADTFKPAKEGALRNYRYVRAR